MMLKVLDRCNSHSFSLNWFHFQLWPAQYALGNKIHFKLLVKCSKYKNFSGLEFIFAASMFL
jgi:hypothetical protein